jgi:hypothetical protein
MRHQRGARQFRDAWPRGALFRQSADAKLTVPVAEDFRQLAPRLASFRRLPAGQRLVPHFRRSGADRIIPEAGPEVRRLSAGGSEIRTLGPPQWWGARLVRSASARPGCASGKGVKPRGWDSPMGDRQYGRDDNHPL